MISPTHKANGRIDAQLTDVANLLIEPARACVSVDPMEARSEAAGSCNSVFRYPSPFGWFCGVPAESPVFSVGGLASGTGAAGCCVNANEPAGSVGRAEGVGPCDLGKLDSRLRRHSGLRPAATQWASKRQSVPVQGLPQRPSLTAILSRAPSSAQVQTSPIATLTQENVDLTSLAAPRSNPTHKPSSCTRAVVAFLLPMPVAAAAVQDQEGR